MNAVTQNPFIIKGYIAPEYFCDREKETAQLISNIVNGRNTVMVSERRMGKTGLIEHVYHRPEIAGNYYTFLIDIYSAGTLREFVFLLGKHIFETLKPRGKKFIDRFFSSIASLRPALRFDEVTGSPSFDIGLGEIRQPEVSLEQIFRYLESADKRCIVAIDEFQQIAKFPDKNVEALLRTHIQRCMNTDFIFAGSIHHMMRDIFFTASRPFYQSVSPMTLGPIEKKKYVDFASGIFKNAGIHITDNVIANVYEWFDGHTWSVQRVLNEIYARTPKGGSVDSIMFLRIIKDIADSYEPMFQSWMINLTERQKEVLIAIAKEGKAREITSADFIRKHGLQSASSVQSSVKQLTAKDIVVKDMGGYSIIDQFFAAWLRETYGLGEFK
jgi:AAA+ ATPase superfamily predicted ATPase